MALPLDFDVFRDSMGVFCITFCMRLQYSILVFLAALAFSTSSNAYVGLKVGTFTSDGSTNIGGGVVFGLPLPVSGLAVEAEAIGFYDNDVVNSFYLQANLGPVYDFNSLITPDSNLLHPFVRAGFAYSWLFYSSNSPISDQSAPGFYTGLGLNIVLPVITLGVEGVYNYINFDGATSTDFWNVFFSAGIHF